MNKYQIKYDYGESEVHEDWGVIEAESDNQAIEFALQLRYPTDQGLRSWCKSCLSAIILPQDKRVDKYTLCKELGLLAARLDFSYDHNTITCSPKTEDGRKFQELRKLINGQA